VGEGPPSGSPARRSIKRKQLQRGASSGGDSSTNDSGTDADKDLSNKTRRFLGTFAGPPIGALPDGRIDWNQDFEIDLSGITRHALITMVDYYVKNEYMKTCGATDAPAAAAAAHNAGACACACAATYIRPYQRRAY
jgi:hypothetical protein